MEAGSSTMALKREIICLIPDTLGWRAREMQGSFVFKADLRCSTEQVYRSN